jgi:hypothetical protein
VFRKNQYAQIKFNIMPIIVKDFSWWQTECKLFLQIKIPHVSQKNADILTSNKYLKVRLTAVFMYLPNKIVGN